ncbi:MAG TPA: UrcA family protein [Allosphingosinicella sp.]|jgi:UrcA family protein
MKAIISLAAAVAAVALAAATPTPVRAQLAERAETVSFADLNLGDPADARRFDRRVARAAESLCGPVSDVDPAGKNAARRCRETASLQVDAALEKVRQTAARARHAKPQQSASR